MIGRWLTRLRERIAGRSEVAAPAESEPGPSFGEAEARLAAALEETDPDRRVAALREALAMGERLPGKNGDFFVLKTSAFLGEVLRGLGEREAAAAHYACAIERSFRLGDPAGRRQRAGSLARLGLLHQQAGDDASARRHYEEALQLGGDTDSGVLLGVLAQAAINLGLIEQDAGDDERTIRAWEQAIDLGTRSGQSSGWDPAAVAAFNLGHLYNWRGNPALARATLQDVGRGCGEMTPLVRMALAKAAHLLASIAERDGLAGEPESVRQYGIAVEQGRASGLVEGALVALQSSIALGNHCSSTGRLDEAVAHFREALVLEPACEAEPALPLVVFARLRLGQSLFEAGDRAECGGLLAEVWTSGRESPDAGVRKHAALAALNLHRVWCAIGRWDEARDLAIEAEAFARTLDSAKGSALVAGAAYARALGRLHDGDAEGAREILPEVVSLGLASENELGKEAALDALLLAGHLDRQAGRREQALAMFRHAVDVLGGSSSPQADSMAAMALVNAAHCLSALGRKEEAGKAYEEALVRGRASGIPDGRAAAANAALNLTGLPGTGSPARRRELQRIAITLGRLSGTPRGAECVEAAERALLGSDEPDEPDDD